MFKLTKEEKLILLMIACALICGILIKTFMFSGKEAEIAAKTNKPVLININSAAPGELVKIPGVGPATAEKIIEYKKIHGKFRSASELLKIKGIGPAKLKKMKPFVRLGAGDRELGAEKAVIPSGE